MIRKDILIKFMIILSFYKILQIDSGRHKATKNKSKN